MPELPVHPDFGQLRRQARELLRDAGNGEPGAAARLRSVSGRATLASAQLAVARGYGYRSWAALKSDVRQRPASRPFFVTLLPEEAGRAASGISVRDARTGAVTEVLKPSAGESFSRLTAAGPAAYLMAACVKQMRVPPPVHPDRPAGGGFIIAGQEHRPAPAKYRLYRLQVDADGRAVMTPVPGDLLPPGVPDLAASPDGSVLAYAVRAGRWTSEAGLADLTTGERRAASLPEGCVSELTLSGDGQTLAFLWHARSAPGEVEVYTAPTAAPDWVAAGKVLTGTDGQPCDAISPVISADGQFVYITVRQPEPAGGPHWNRLLEVPVGGGQPRTLFKLRYQPHGGNLAYMWGPVCLSRAGDQLLAFATGYAYRIDVSSGEVTRLPFPEGQAVDAAW